MPMNNRLLRPLQTPGLLDLVPGAAAAYSLRSLSRSYADPVVTVRRSSDDAEEDFTAAEVADGTLAAFCGAGDGFVYRWWDQSGNARHAVASADANEPQIVDAGVLVGLDNNPSISFDGSDDYLPHSVIEEDPSNLFLISVNEIDSSAAFGTIWSHRSESTRVIQHTSAVASGIVRTQIRGSGNNLVDLSNTVTFDTSHITGFQFSKTQQSHANFVDGVTGETSTEAFSGETFTSTKNTIGATYTTSYTVFFKGKVSEIVVYKNHLDASTVSLLQGNIAWSYSQ